MGSAAANTALNLANRHEREIAALQQQIAKIKATLASLAEESIAQSKPVAQNGTRRPPP